MYHCPVGEHIKYLLQNYTVDVLWDCDLFMRVDVSLCQHLLRHFWR